jgi:hypothetical protein
MAICADKIKRAGNLFRSAEERNLKCHYGRIVFQLMIIDFIARALVIACALCVQKVPGNLLKKPRAYR